jgi:DNA-binding LacI/PurR family transcriptional regulator
VIREFKEHDDIYHALRKRMTSATPPTAAIAVNDSLAADMLSMLTADRIKVPEQFSIVGYDDYASSAHTLPPLATVHMEKLSRIGVEMLLKRIKKPDSPVVKYLLPTEFVARASAGKLSSEYPTHLQ